MKERRTAVLAEETLRGAWPGGRAVNDRDRPESVCSVVREALRRVQWMNEMRRRFMLLLFPCNSSEAVIHIVKRKSEARAKRLVDCGDKRHRTSWDGVSRDMTATATDRLGVAGAVPIPNPPPHSL